MKTQLLSLAVAVALGGLVPNLHSVRAAEAPAAAVPVRLQAVETRASQLNTRLHESRSLLAQQQNTPAAQLAEALRAAEAARADREAELERLRRDLSEAERLRRVQAESEADLDQQTRQWQARLTQARQTLQDLARQEAELLGRTDSDRGPRLTQGVNRQGREISKTLLLRNNLVAPLDATHFEITRIRYVQSGRTGTKVEPRQPGDPVGTALKPGGCLADALATTKPGTQFVALFVAPDSIEAYYAVRTELRKKGLLHRFDTWDGRLLLLGGGGGGASDDVITP